MKHLSLSEQCTLRMHVKAALFLPAALLLCLETVLTIFNFDLHLYILRFLRNVVSMCWI